ncbi:cupin domain-containing protein [Endozoicomonas gorgoniicola]|uniref:Cupin domain-containing protein n=1 Tax=Endozoicomonas gorgoniicola TaxID=1234144 RepID=A0ABT3MX33_9GAMM|nr:cupin domain-containing protein [Endozoicomonas gorgoniicola]MCW7553940.1 cupin domain-containing protein [Endozoicomonas gorgoniicola]
MRSIINLKDALNQAKPDDHVGIAIAPLSAGKNFCLFSAEIKSGHKVGCHYHTEGEEIYSILSGEGIIYTANIDNTGTVGETRVHTVTSGDSFTIEAGTAHQLQATSDLVLMFVYPPSHIDSDRIMIPSIISQSSNRSFNGKGKFANQFTAYWRLLHS